MYVKIAFFFTQNFIRTQCGCFTDQTTFPGVLSSIEGFGFMGARVEKLFEVKMAEKEACGTQDGSVFIFWKISPANICVKYNNNIR